MCIHNSIAGSLVMLRFEATPDLLAPKLLHRAQFQQSTIGGI
jgi:hypothetical protein